MPDETNGVTWRNRVWGEIAIKGRDITVIILIALLGGIVYIESRETHTEHKDIMCLLRLQIWTTLAKEEDFSIQRLPREYWNCLPEAMGKLKGFER